MAREHMVHGPLVFPGETIYAGKAILMSGIAFLFY